MNQLPKTKTPYWDFNDRLSDRLMVWSALSVFVGAVLSVRGTAYWRGVAAHFVTWGLIDAGIAWIGIRNTDKSRKLPLDEQPAKELADAKNIWRLLWINTFLDLFYMLGGRWLYTVKGKDDPHYRGQGVGVYVQAGFLFLFDIIHAVIIGRMLKKNGRD